MNFKHTLWIFLFFNLLGYTQKPLDISIVNAKMSQQENSWNKGSINEFMNHYWKSDSLTFTGKNGVQYGWQNTLDNYLKSYPDKAQMGTLKFTTIRIQQIDLNTITVLGKWELSRENLIDLNGYYSLIWQKKNNQWVIISDHSS